MSKTVIIAFWCPFSDTPSEFYTPYYRNMFQSYHSIQIVDCRNKQDASTISLLKQADLIVIGFSFGADRLDFWHVKSLFPDKNLIFAITDYFPSSYPGDEYVCRFYRLLPQKLAHIPYNVQYKDALAHGTAMEYIKTRKISGGYDCFMQFHRELRRTARLYLQALDFSCLGSLT